jgi:hypothetical protein
MTEIKLYQVVYCVEAKYSLCDGDWWQNWYLLKCPLVGITSLAEAREMAKAWKISLGAIFQPVIIGEEKSDFEKIGIDILFGVSAIGGLDAPEEEQPDFMLQEDLNKGEVDEG